MTEKRRLPLTADQLDAAVARQIARGRPETALAFIAANARHAGEECLYWPFSRFHTGYGKVSVLGRVMFAHRVMCVAAHGSPPTDQHDAAHTCGKGHEGCINPKHLRWATHTENVNDKIQHGTLIAGCRNYNAKLSPEQVKAIKATDFSKRGSMARAARELGISRNIVIRVATGQAYRHD